MYKVISVSITVVLNYRGKQVYFNRVSKSIVLRAYILLLVCLHRWK